MSRTHKFLGGVGVNYLHQGVVVLTGLWLTSFLLRRVGQDDYGAWLVVIQLLAILDLCDLGVVALVPRETAYATGAVQGTGSRAAAVAALLARVRRVIRWQMPLVILAGLTCWVIAVMQDARLAWPVGAVACCSVILFPLRTYQPVLQGLQDLLVLGCATSAGWLLQTVLTVVLILAGFGFWALATAWLAQRTFLIAFSWYRLRRAYPGVLTTRPTTEADHSECKRLLCSGLWVSVSRVAQVLLNGAEILVLARVLGPAAVVVYSCTAKLSAVLGTQAYTLATTAEAGLSELRVSGSAERIAQVSTALSQLMLLASGLIFCVLLAVNAGFVAWWVGPTRYGGDLLTLLLLVVMLLRHLTFTLGHALYCFGHERALGLIALADGAVTLGGAVVFVGWAGPAGAALSSLLGVCLVNLPACLYLLCRDRVLSLEALLLAQLPWLWRFLLVAAAVWGLSTAWPPRGLLGLSLAGTGVCALYGLVMAPMIGRSTLGSFLRPRLSTIPAWIQRPFASHPA